jgi:hypothetical protein
MFCVFGYLVAVGRKDVCEREEMICACGDSDDMRTT